jgi:hypothetical protein
VKLLDVLLGRTKVARPDLDRLFGLSTAAVTLEADAGLTSTGKAGVSFKVAAGQAFEATRAELEQILAIDAKESGATLSENDDDYGYHWVVLEDPVLEDLVVKVHMVNSTLESHGFGPQLLCSVFGFAKSGRTTPVYLVYLYKRGTFYPFAPVGAERRDNELELSLRGTLAGVLPIEADLSRWFPVWNVPV